MLSRTPALYNCTLIKRINHLDDDKLVSPVNLEFTLVNEHKLLIRKFKGVIPEEFLNERLSNKIKSTCYQLCKHENPRFRRVLN